jgi:hypothetical protein
LFRGVVTIVLVALTLIFAFLAGARTRLWSIISFLPQALAATIARVVIFVLAVQLGLACLLASHANIRR